MASKLNSVAESTSYVSTTHPSSTLERCSPSASYHPAVAGCRAQHSPQTQWSLHRLLGLESCTHEGRRRLCPHLQMMAVSMAPSRRTASRSVPSWLLSRWQSHPRPAWWHSTASARAGNRRFVPLSALCAHTKTQHKTDLLWETLRALNRPGRTLPCGTRGHSSIHQCQSEHHGAA